MGKKLKTIQFKSIPHLAKTMPNKYQAKDFEPKKRPIQYGSDSEDDNKENTENCAKILGVVYKKARRINGPGTANHGLVEDPTEKQLKRMREDI